MKKCSKCGVTKPLSEFSKDSKAPGGLYCWCKQCSRKNVRKHYWNNRKRLLAQKKEWRQSNPEEARARDRESRKRNKEGRLAYYREHRKETLARLKEYRKQNRERLKAKQRIYESKRRERDPRYRLNKSISDMVRRGLRGRKAGRKWESLVGYTMDSLTKHLEEQFDNMMTWDNYGSYWHLDHIRPKSWFDYESERDNGFRECWSLDNLQPMEARKNLVKNNNYEG